MKTLTLILTQYNEGKISLKEMVEMVNEFGIYLLYKRVPGGCCLRAIINNEIVEASI